MAHGTPDYGLTKKDSTIFGLDDLGELAVRLGSIVSFDRRGDVVGLDDFEQGILAWGATAFGAGSSIASSTEACRSGGKSLKLVTGTTEADYPFVIRGIAYRPTTNMGIEASFALLSIDTALVLQGRVYDGTYIHWPTVRYDGTAQTLALRNEAEAWVTFASSVNVAAARHIFPTLKMVFDLTSAKYVRCLLGGSTYLLSAYSYYKEALASAPTSQTAMWTLPRGAAARTTYIDDWILTINEPG